MESGGWTGGICFPQAMVSPLQIILIPHNEQKEDQEAQHQVHNKQKEHQETLSLLKSKLPYHYSSINHLGI